jgi:hypothetical protein
MDDERSENKSMTRSSLSYAIVSGWQTSMIDMHYKAIFMLYDIVRLVVHIRTSMVIIESIHIAVNVTMSR